MDSLRNWAPVIAPGRVIAYLRNRHSFTSLSDPVKDKDPVVIEKKADAPAPSANGAVGLGGDIINHQAAGIYGAAISGQFAYQVKMAPLIRLADVDA